MRLKTKDLKYVLENFGLERVPYKQATGSRASFGGPTIDLPPRRQSIA